MSNAVPSKPPVRPFNPTYAVTTTTRVPGRSASAVPRPRDGEQADAAVPDPTAGPAS